MINQVGRYAVSAEHGVPTNKHVLSEADDVIGVVQSPAHAPNVAVSQNHTANANADYAHQSDPSIQPATDLYGDAVASHVHATGQTGSNVSDAAELTIVGVNDGHTYSADQSHLTSFSAPDFSHIRVTSLGLMSDDHLSGIFDRIETLSSESTANLSRFADDSSHSLNGDSDGSSTLALPGPASLHLDPSESAPIDVFSDARGHGGGGGGTTGGSVPAAWTTNTSDVHIHINWDSSVGSAPSSFVSSVESAANFLTSFFTDAHGSGFTINLNVGYGEVGGTKLAAGALGESETYLASVSYSQLASLFSGAGYLSDVTLGGQQPSGNLYTSFAEAKALAIAVPNQVDGYVGFSSQIGIFDFTVSNDTVAIPSGQYDLFGVVAHELAEVMGRLLLVGNSISGSPGYMAFDLFHYLNGAQDFSGNGGYFSSNGGSTIIAGFNNSSNGGDAGDWSSSGTSGSPVQGPITLSAGTSATYDAFNAFGTPGQSAPVTNTDLWALHAVGFDLAQTVKVA